MFKKLSTGPLGHGHLFCWKSASFSSVAGTESTYKFILTCTSILCGPVGFLNSKLLIEQCTSRVTVQLKVVRFAHGDEG